MAPKGDIPLAQEWQLECEGLRERAGIVLRTERWTDCSFLVGSEGLEIKAHKLMLAMASPVFEAMFYGGLAEAAGHAIRVPDIEPDVFNAMLEFIYTDNYKINCDIMAIDIYYAAQKYMLPKLQKNCSSYLSKNLTPDIVCRVYEFSLMVSEKALSGDCKKVLLSKTEDALKSNCFLDMNMDMVVEIFSWDELEISSELVLIQAAQRYNQALKARSRDAGHKAMVHMNVQQIINRQEGGDTGYCSQSASDENVNDVKPVNTGAGDMGHGDQIKRKNDDSDDIELEVENIETKKKRVTPEVVADGEMLRVLRQVRFLTLTPKQIVEEESLLTLLPRDEVLAILYNATSDKAVLPMPNGFSTNRNKRSFSEDLLCLECGVKTVQQIMNRQEGGDTGNCSQSASGDNVNDVKPVNAGAGDMGHGDQIKRENGDSNEIKLKVENVETKKKREVVADREILRVLRQIRFLSLTPKQIAEEESLLTLLTRNEMLDILVNANAVKAVLPMPNGFSTNKNKRYKKGCRREAVRQLWKENSTFYLGENITNNTL